ncbi:MAG: NCS2 family permease [Clostridia bacterium]|nr:NCS2 family permease [Clostridia bacterium]
MIDSFFKISERKSDIRTEVTAGVTTFLTMAYILAVNPAILSDAGMNPHAVMIATALAAVIGTFCMALMANYPFALAPALGLNAFFAYTVCGSMGFSWQMALFAVFIEGIIFIILSVTNVREAIFNAIPVELKKGVTAGIGLFVAFIGLQKGGIVKGNPSTLVTIASFRDNFHTSGIFALLTFIGLFIICALYIRRVKGSVFFGIIITWIIGMFMQVAGIYKPDPQAGYGSIYPTWEGFDIGAVSDTFGQCFSLDFASISLADFLIVIFSFLFVDMFDTIGTLIGVAGKAGLLDENGRLPKIRGALLADAIATCSGAVLGTSTTSTFVESAAGVADGGKTGFASVITGSLFLLSLLLAPLFVSIPYFATAPAMIFVGFLMIQPILSLDYTNYGESVPAYLCMLIMPLTYSVSDGIAIGIVSYVLVNLIAGKSKKLTPLLYVLAVLFMLKYALL